MKQIIQFKNHNITFNSNKKDINDTFVWSYYANIILHNMLSTFTESFSQINEILLVHVSV